MKQIEIIKPKIIVPLGNVALKALLPEDKLLISKVHGKTLERNGIIYFPIYHPSAAMRFTKMRNAAMQDMVELGKLIRSISK